MTRLITRKEIVTTTTVVTTSNSTPFSTARAKTISAQCVVDVNTPAAKTFVAGTSEVQTFTVPALVAGAADGDVAILTDGSGLTWGFYFDTTGLNAVVPTSAAYLAIPVGRRTLVDISLAVDNTGIVTACTTALNALTGFTDAVTLSGATTLIATMVVRNPCTDPLVRAFDGIAAATSFSGAQTTAGVASTVDITANTVTKVAHGLVTGTKGQATSTGTLPAGITTGVDYFIIAVDADTFKFAETLVLAQAGTAIDLTNQGTGAATHTFTPTSLAGATVGLQKSNDYSPILGTGTWDAVAAATSITADADIWLSDIDPTYAWCRLSYTLTAGQLSASSVLVVKEDL